MGVFCESASFEQFSRTPAITNQKHARQQSTNPTKLVVLIVEQLVATA